MNNRKQNLILALFIAVLAIGPLDAQSETTPLFSAEELAWIESHPIIRVAGPKAFPPFHYFENRQAKGMAPEYVELLVATLGIGVEYIPDLRWPEVLSGIKTGEIDLIACAAKSEERTEYINFSLPFLSFPMVIVSRRDASFMAGSSDLHGSRIASVKHVTTYEWLTRDGIEFDPYFVDTPLKALEAVSTGLADTYVGNLAASTYLIEKNGLANLKVAAPTTYGNYDLHMAARADWPLLINIVDKALTAIEPSTRTEIRNRWIKVRYEHGIRTTDILKWAGTVATVAMIIILVFVFWNRRLKREIRGRLQTELELNNARTEVSTLSGLLPICSSCKNIRDDEGYWTQIEEYIKERSQARFSHGICPKCTDKLYPELQEDKIDEIPDSN